MLSLLGRAGRTSKPEVIGRQSILQTQAMTLLLLCVKSHTVHAVESSTLYAYTMWRTQLHRLMAHAPGQAAGLHANLATNECRASIPSRVVARDVLCLSASLLLHKHLLYCSSTRMTFPHKVVQQYSYTRRHFVRKYKNYLYIY